MNEELKQHVLAMLMKAREIAHKSTHPEAGEFYDDAGALIEELDNLHD